MRTTLNELRKLIEEIVNESSWSEWFGDERVEKYRAHKRAEENTPWTPSTRLGSSAGQKQGLAAPQNYVTKMTREEAENISSKATKSAEREFGNLDVVKFYIGNDGNVYVSDVNSDWFRWDDVQNLWHGVPAPDRIVGEARMCELVEAWSNAAIMGKARERRMNPRVWNRKEMTRQFYAKPRAPVPPATGPDPTAPPPAPRPPSSSPSPTRKKISFMDAVRTWRGAAEELAYDELNIDTADIADDDCEWYVLDGGKYQVYDTVNGWTWEYDGEDWHVVNIDDR
jgi:hypothetical protein